MSGPKPLVAVGDPRLKQQIHQTIGFSSDLHPGLFLTAGSGAAQRARERPLVILGSQELSRYRTRNPRRLNVLKRHACLIVVLQSYDAGKILEAVRLADGLVFHDVNLGRMRLIADLAGSGYVAIPSTLTAMLMTRGLRRELLQSLNTVESRVLGLLGRGSSNRMIGEALQLDEGRTKYLIRSVFKKLHLQNRTQAAVFARDVLISAPEPLNGKSASFAQHLTSLFPS
jgi:two-component system nitrate/nitrite response regulator NarL